MTGRDVASFTSSSVNHDVNDRKISPTIKEERGKHQHQQRKRGEIIGTNSQKTVAHGESFVNAILVLGMSSDDESSSSDHRKMQFLSPSSFSSPSPNGMTTTVTTNVDKRSYVLLSPHVKHLERLRRQQQLMSNQRFRKCHRRDYPSRESLMVYFVNLTFAFLILISLVVNHCTSSPSSSSQSSETLNSSFTSHPRHHKLLNTPLTMTNPFLPSQQEETGESFGGCLTCGTSSFSNSIDELKRAKFDAIKQQILSKLHLSERPRLERRGLLSENYLDAIRISHGMGKRKGRNLKRRRKTRGYPSEDSKEASFVLENKSKRFMEEEHGLLELSSSVTRDDLPEGENFLNSEEEEEDYYGKTSQVITFAEEGVSLNGNSLLHFNPPPETHFLDVTAAILWVHLSRGQKRDERQFKTPVTLYVFKVTEEKDLSVAFLARKKIHNSIRLGGGGMKHINITDVVKKWLSDTERQDKRLTLLVDCVGCSQQGIKLHQKGHNGSLPFIAINTRVRQVNETTTGRNRRHLHHCTPSASKCCRQPLWISFKEIGWDDWIIAPKGYWANFCGGGCATRRGEVGDRASLKTFHSHVLAEYRLTNPYASISPCCGPTKLSHMSLLYFDSESRIIKADLPKMIVEDCGCT